MQTYDVIIIGAGTAGQTAASTLAENGLKVAVVEKSDRPGGICALAGCQAKKWYYEAAETVARSRHLLGRGIAVPSVADWSMIHQQKRVFTDAVPASTVQGLKGYGIDLIEGEASFSGETRVVVNGDSLRADHFIVAAGATPATLPFRGAEHLITSREFLDLTACPARLVFVGGGFISFEFAHFAARLGPAGSVTILEAAARPLGSFDTDMVTVLEEASKADGIDIRTGVVIDAVEKTRTGYAVRTTSGVFEADLVVNGAGRAPALGALNLGAAGVEVSPEGIIVDAAMRTTSNHIFAVGDCAATIQLARVADYEAYVAAVNILATEAGGGNARVDYRAVPFVLFTYPQCARVGATEDELKARGVSYQKSFQRGLGWPTYRRIGLQHAAYKILIDDDRKILGAHFIADNTTGLVNFFREAILDGRAVDELYWRSVMTPYPSRESDVKYMLDAFMEEDYLDHMI